MRSWQLRARLTVILIEMAEALKHMQYSRLYMCDVKEQNFIIKIIVLRFWDCGETGW